MSDDYQCIEIITGTPRRRRWTAEQKLRIVEESHQSGESISAVARRRGVEKRFGTLSAPMPKAGILSAEDLGLTETIRFGGSRESGSTPMKKCGTEPYK